MVPATFDALQDVKQLMWRHQSYRAAGDSSKKLKKPARLFEGGGRLFFPLHLLNILLSDEPEGCLCSEFGRDTPLTLLLHRVDAINKLGASLVALLARLRERQVGDAAKRQLPFMAQHFVAKSPKQRTGGLNDKEEPIGVGNLERRTAGLSERI